jgi:hypothetical protein
MSDVKQIIIGKVINIPSRNVKLIMNFIVGVSKKYTVGNITYNINRDSQFFRDYYRTVRK